jgi:hypothetical protein
MLASVPRRAKTDDLLSLVTRRRASAEGATGLRAFPQPLGNIPQPGGANGIEMAVTVLNSCGLFIALGFNASFWFRVDTGL